MIIRWEIDMTKTRLCILTISLATCVTAGAALAWEDDSGIVPIDSKITTVKTYADLGSEWWQWAVQAPATDNPLLDKDGSNCRVGQQGPVWFLAGTQGSGKPTVRRCEVPGGKAIFFPVINNVYFAFLSDPPEQRTAEFVRTTAETGCDSSSIRGISVTIDGTRVAEPARFVTTAEQSPLFQAQLPTDNIFGFTEGQVPELLLSPAAHKGFYLYLKPLPPGNHIIKWTATWDCTFGGPFGENITYKLKVLTGVSGQQQ
jgi:hypothetical protein